jgi:hypothetical protein
MNAGRDTILPASALTRHQAAVFKLVGLALASRA